MLAIFSTPCPSWSAPEKGRRSERLAGRLNAKTYFPIWAPKTYILNRRSLGAGLLGGWKKVSAGEPGDRQFVILLELTEANLSRWLGLRLGFRSRSGLGLNRFWGSRFRLGRSGLGLNRFGGSRFGLGRRGFRLHDFGRRRVDGEEAEEAERRAGQRGKAKPRPTRTREPLLLLRNWAENQKQRKPMRRNRARPMKNETLCFPFCLNQAYLILHTLYTITSNCLDENKLVSFNNS